MIVTTGGLEVDRAVPEVFLCRDEPQTERQEKEKACTS
jgi:hypothetical protein